jgi:tRNA threonylcarbamoyladenosine biosynthesis protein TsaE
MLKIISTSANETKMLAETFAKKLKGGEVLALSGNLGSGKTTFVKGLARGLGIKQKIQSPTFAIRNEFKLKKTKPKIFYHLDLYRLKSVKDLAELGIAEWLCGPTAITAIEWPEKAKRLLPKRTVYIRFSHTKKPNERTIKIT